MIRRRFLALAFAAVATMHVPLCRWGGGEDEERSLWISSGYELDGDGYTQHVTRVINGGESTVLAAVGVVEPWPTGAVLGIAGPSWGKGQWVTR